jgi:hypothetical protein
VNITTADFTATSTSLPLGEPAARPSSPPVVARPSAAPPAFAPCSSARTLTRRTQACVVSRRLNLVCQLRLAVFSVLLLLARSSCSAGCLAPPPRFTPDPRRATSLCVCCASPTRSTFVPEGFACDHGLRVEHLLLEPSDEERDRRLDDLVAPTLCSTLCADRAQ